MGSLLGVRVEGSASAAVLLAKSKRASAESLHSATSGRLAQHVT